MAGIKPNPRLDPQTDSQVTAAQDQQQSAAPDDSQQGNDPDSAAAQAGDDNGATPQAGGVTGGQGGGGADDGSDDGSDDSDGGPDEVGDEQGMSPNVSPQEQEQYKDFVLAGLALIYTKQGGQAIVRPGILKLLDNDPSDLRQILKIEELKVFSPIVAIAATTAIIVIELLKIAGKDRPDAAVIMHGGAAILEELATIWMSRNHQQLGEDDVHKAMSMAMDIFRETAADQGLINVDSLKQQFAQLVQADKSGNLAKVSPDLAGINKAAQMNAQAPSGEQPGQDDQQDPNQQQQQPSGGPQ